MSATDSPNHPANSGRGARTECPNRSVIFVRGEKWHLDCVLKKDHAGQHIDIRGRRWPRP